mmetsp:Transcript_4050/g.3822  ORF Transcript_4050/g.3822 Transcript_4050/m.3822 type:complete len:252 (-) Transcript_4050:197-952(-)|eukprot:CAMPEP_0197831994 /NCGR_PEP_ID=MMETSP1437-20131217/12890_1 /TAXON_ID=49252 ORGANISM="Eucampia antarctica, Strain CCMP1452" /NCGR_SAMPLE_ID=MMETSP1437 /ASSEMBLY_ACC=CAM_ASM_001096 /LENGTH=251 /DNA_ID=CAMNT_0043435149 /DNA_START=37 /DNA_END=792 /DNA_ORIENTATION=-
MYIGSGVFSVALVVCVICLFSTQVVCGFGWGGNASSKSKKVVVSEATLQEALTVFENRFQLSNASKKTFKPFFTQWGVPKKDLDGSLVRTTSEKGVSKRMVNTNLKDQKAAFTEIARIYGEDAALQMVKDLPYALAFNKSNFAANYKVYEDVFGEEPAKAMVKRNPGLLAIKPEDALKTDEQTMAFSYLVSTFRPVSDVAFPLLLLLLSTPAIERFSGIPIRTTFLGLLTNSSPEQVAQALQSVADPLGVL